MAKDVVYNLRWSAELRDRVQEYAKKNMYDDMATLIREAIQEKIDPVMREERLEKEIEKLFQNPNFRRNLGLK